MLWAKTIPLSKRGRVSGNSAGSKLRKLCLLSAQPETPDGTKYVFRFGNQHFFCQIKEIVQLSGGVVRYAAQTNAQLDTELVKKGGFRTETIWNLCR